MQKTNILHLDYTSSRKIKQLRLPLELEYNIPADDPVRLVDTFVEEMDLADLYKTYSRIRKNQATPAHMLKIVLYAAMNRQYSSRSIEIACKRDINFMFLLEGFPAPDHATIARFISVHLAACPHRIMSEMDKILYRLGEISARDIFIDGTKIESVANKYTFVWKRAVTKNMAKLFEKVLTLVEETEEQYGLHIVYNNRVSLHTLKRMRKKLCRLKKESGISFVHGIGRRKPSIQKSIELTNQYISKLQEYVAKLHKCGTRNSYSKTDKDATFMRMKEDAMLNGQLKPAYNLQHGVDSEYIVWAEVYPNPTDANTLIPFMDSMARFLRFPYQNIVADAGYESEENYRFIELNGQTAYIKPNNFEISKKKSYKQDISRRENMSYDASRDCYFCHAGRMLSKQYVKTNKTRAGYKREVAVYSGDCSGCMYKSSCIKGNNCKTPLKDRNKVLNVSRYMESQRQACLQRLLSPFGTQLRMNRSIQVEGSFANIKEDMGLRRYSYRGKSNVLTESIIVAIAFNITRFDHRIKAGRAGLHLYELKKTA
ncbi:MAG: IS1182 family transposase [Anaerovibrio sp.]